MGDTSGRYGFPSKMSGMRTSGDASEEAGRKKYKAGKKTNNVMI